MHRPASAAAALFLALLVPSTPALAQVIGKAGAVELTEADVRRIVATLPGETRSALVGDDAALEQFVRGELARRLLLQELRARGFDRDPAALAELDRLRDEALLRLWVARQARVPEGFPSEAEVVRAYETARNQRGEVAEYRLAQIFVALPDGAPPARAAEALRRTVEIQGRVAGGDFGQLAKQYSEHADSAGKGGDLGFLPEANLIPEVRAAVAGVAPGSVVGPVKTAQGLHFVKLLERRPTPAPALAEVREQLVAALRQQRAVEAQREYLAGLGQGASISVNQVELGRLRASMQ